MQNKRIIKETLADGTIQYRVEVFREPLFIWKGYWETDTYYTYFDEFDYEVNVEAVFDTLGEAEEYVFGHSKSKEVVKQEILHYD